MVKWHPGELYLRVGFIVTNMSGPAENAVTFYSKRGTAQQSIMEGKGATRGTRAALSPPPLYVFSDAVTQVSTAPSTPRYRS